MGEKSDDYYVVKMKGVLIGQSCIDCMIWFVWGREGLHGYLVSAIITVSFRLDLYCWLGQEIGGSSFANLFVTSNPGVKMEIWNIHVTGCLPYYYKIHQTMQCLELTKLSRFAIFHSSWGWFWVHEKALMVHDGPIANPGCNHGFQPSFYNLSTSLALAIQLNGLYLFLVVKVNALFLHKISVQIVIFVSHMQSHRIMQPGKDSTW